MSNIFNCYKKVGLIPFSVGVKYDKDTKKKVIEGMPKHTTITKFDKENIKDDINGLGIRMGTKLKSGKYVIGIDIDNKEDCDQYKNGMTKWEEIKGDINTPYQITGNKGLHYLFQCTEEQIKRTQSITGLEIDGIKYSIDVKTTNGLLFAEPTQYRVEKNAIRKYKWEIRPDAIPIQDIPEWLFDMIKCDRIVEKKTTPIRTKKVATTHLLLPTSEFLQ
jgi:hypothetical protein